MSLCGQWVCHYNDPSMTGHSFSCYPCQCDGIEDAVGSLTMDDGLTVFAASTWFQFPPER